MKTKIYVLLDKNSVIRYVGKTVGSMERRLSNHVCDAKTDNPCHRLNWIRKCLSEGYVPIIRLLEEVKGDGRQEEIYWIKFFREVGLDLVNSTDGGDGTLGCKSGLGRKHSSETKTKMSLAAKGKKKSPEHRVKISLALKGKKLSSETKTKMSLAHKGKSSGNLGKKASPETRAKLSLAHKGNKNSLGCHHSVETRTKISLAMKGKKNTLDCHQRRKSA